MKGGTQTQSNTLAKELLRNVLAINNLFIRSSNELVFDVYFLFVKKLRHTVVFNH